MPGRNMRQSTLISHLVSLGFFDSHSVMQYPADLMIKILPGKKVQVNLEISCYQPTLVLKISSWSNLSPEREHREQSQ